MVGELAAVCRTLDGYCRLLDEGQDDAWLALFCPAGRLVVNGRAFEGHDGLRVFLAARRPGPGLHLNTIPALRELGPDELACELTFFGLKPGTEGTMISGVGRYRDRLVRHDGGWRFAERQVILAQGF